MARRPHSIRNSPDKWDDYDGPFDGVPEWLQPALLEWVFGRLGRYPLNESLVQRLEQRLRRPIERRGDHFESELTAEPELLLDVIDELLLLERWDPQDGNPRLIALLIALNQAGSAYTVAEDASGHYELQVRVPDEARAACQAAMEPPDRSGEHLKAAWSKAFGRNPDPNGAYDHAVKAVETAGRAIVSPKNQRTTLGTMIYDMRNKPEKWTTVLDSVDDVSKVIGVMELLWHGQYRHGDESKPINHTQPQAEIAVQLAVALVQMFRSGALRPV